MAPVSAPLPAGSPQLPQSPKAKLPQSPQAKPSSMGKAPVDADIHVCLDFLKGRCGRKRCRFLHPDLSQYQQLSGVAEAQAGRRICEVWAMTGQCKFSAKCNKLHPVIISQPTQPANAFPNALAALSYSAPDVPQRAKPLTTPTSRPLQSPPDAAAPCLGAAVTPAPLRPRHIALPLRAAPDFEAEGEPATDSEFRDFAESILQALENEESSSRIHQPTAVAPPSGDHCSPSDRSLASLFGMDRALLDILSDLNCATH